MTALLKRCISESCLGQEAKILHCQKWLYQWTLLLEYQVLETADWFRFSFPPCKLSEITHADIGNSRALWSSEKEVSVGTAGRCRAVHRFFLCPQAPLNPVALQFSRGDFKSFIVFFLSLSSPMIPKMLQGPFSSVWIAAFYCFCWK